MRVLSVDLGTSNTVAVLSSPGREPRVLEVDGSSTMPSAVFADENGRLVVGREAERRARLDPSRFEPNPKRRVDDGNLLLGTAVVPVTQALAAVLGKVVAETVRQLDGARPEQVRLTHPAQWGAVRRNTLLSAARQAGFGPDLHLVPEPVAAAAHYASVGNRPVAPGQALAVYDLGAGTFDVAIVGATAHGFTVLAENGLADLGGLDIDQALLDHIGRQVAHKDPQSWQRLLHPQSTADRRAGRVLRDDVRAAKEALSQHPHTEVPLPEQFGDVLISRPELEGLIRANLARSVQLLTATVRAAGTTVDRLAGIYLVGGSSRIPLVATLIAEQLRIVPTTLDQPETAVALGAQQVHPKGLGPRTHELPPESGTPTPAPAAPQWTPPPLPQPAAVQSTRAGHDGITILPALLLLISIGFLIPDAVLSLVEASKGSGDLRYDRALGGWDWRNVVVASACAIACVPVVIAAVRLLRRRGGHLLGPIVSGVIALALLLIAVFDLLVATDVLLPTMTFAVSWQVHLLEFVIAAAAFVLCLLPQTRRAILANRARSAAGATPPLGWGHGVSSSRP